MSLHVGLVGAGTLGRTAALAALGADSPVTVVVRGGPARADVVRGLLDAALDREAARGRLTDVGLAAQRRNLRVVSDLAALADVDVVIESVAESLVDKRGVLAELEQIIRPDALVASTTSTIPAAQLAAHARHPERVVVAHYVWPAHRMPLVEVACHDATSAPARARLDAMLDAQGKHVVAVADRPGFLITRALFAYWDATLQLVAGGQSPAGIDAALVAAGWPMGPARVMESTGLRSVARIHDGVAAALGHRFRALAALQGVLDGSPDVEHPRFEDDLVAALRVAVPTGGPVDPVDPVEHTARALAVEVDRCVAEGVVSSWAVAGAAIDLAYGFPTTLGGLHRWSATRSLQPA